jgi:hypothetical protein
MAVSVWFVRRWLLCATGIVGAMGVLVLSACGDDTVQAPAANAPAASAPAATSVAAATESGIPESLAFTAPRVGGGTIDMAQYAGTPVLLWFWAPT